jgi:ankyrin repeat protein
VKVAILLCLLAIPGVDVNTSSKGESQLLFGARVGSIKLVETLLQFPQTDVNVANPRGTALIIALEGKFHELALKLIECDRVDLNHVTDSGQIAMGAAAEYARPDVARALLDLPRFVPKRHDGLATFRRAVVSRQWETAKAILDSHALSIDFAAFTGARPSAGASRTVQHWDEDPMPPGNSPVDDILQSQLIPCARVPASLLGVVVTQAPIDVVKSLARNPSFLNISRDVALYLMKAAIIGDKLAMVECLIRPLDDNPHLVIDNEQILAIAVGAGAQSVALFIASHPRFDPARANVTAILRSAMAPATPAPMSLLPIAVQLPGIDVAATDGDGRLLLITLMRADITLASLLAGREGIDWNVRDPTTLDTPLIMLAKKAGWGGRGHHQVRPIVDELVGIPEIDVNAQNKEGNTAMMESARTKNSHITALIAAHRECRFDITNNAGETALKLARCDLPPDAERARIVEALHRGQE